MYNSVHKMMPALRTIYSGVPGSQREVFVPSTTLDSSECRHHFLYRIIHLPVLQSHHPNYSRFPDHRVQYRYGTNNTLGFPTIESIIHWVSRPSSPSTNCTLGFTTIEFRYQFYFRIHYHRISVLILLSNTI